MKKAYAMKRPKEEELLFEHVKLTVTIGVVSIYLSIILFCSTHTLEYPAFQKSQMSVCCQLYTKTTLLWSKTNVLSPG